MEKGIPSPFWGKEENEELLAEIEAVCKKYGFNSWFLAFGNGNEDETSWQASSSEISEGLIEFTDICKDYMREQIDEHKED